MTLPIHAVLPDLLRALRERSNAVVVAPPGAGKTTAIAPALLDQPWCAGQILLLSPRRLAARAAAERMAELAGEPVGRTIGYATRMDRRQSSATRILVLTEGIFRNRIQADPELAGVSAVLFDEVHERSLDSDFGLALALDAQGGLRPDLRLLAMSATLDGARFAALMGDCPVIESAGRAHPLTLRHLGRKAEVRIEDAMAAAIRRAVAEEAEGDVLAFLPGIAEIERTAERLSPDRSSRAQLRDNRSVSTMLDANGVTVNIHPLHGSLDPAEQRAATLAGQQRKLILATSIAETSLTINGVRIVIDSGLARRARYDRTAGTTRLVTERVSQAAATQRAGRAARQGPGIAYRLWEEAATAGLPRFDPPEILEADLSVLLLDCAIWGVRDPARLKWLDPPPAAALAEAHQRLTLLGAFDDAGDVTSHGRALAALPLPVRLAHMLIVAQPLGFVHDAAEAAVLLSERGLGGNDVDLAVRHARWQSDRGARAEAARDLARRLVGLTASSPLQGGGLGGGTRQLRSIGSAPPLKGGGLSEPLATPIALAFPDRVARRRDASGEQWLSVSGRGYRLNPAHPLARQDWLAVADVQGAAAGARITAAVAITLAEVESLFADRIERTTHVRYDPETRSARAESARRLGAIALSHGQDAQGDPAALAAALVEGVRSHGLDQLDWPEAARQLRERARWAGLNALDDTTLLASLDQWLAPLVAGKRRLDAIAPGALHDALFGLLAWEGQQTLERLAPAVFRSPAGTTHPIDYAAPGGPTVELRVQALFGLATHPIIGPEQTPLILSLTSPAGRPIQTTRDLPGFWAGSWGEVAKEMRGRYPRHNWPDDPTAAPASLKTKKALDRQR